jgi:hypothetical protein
MKLPRLLREPQAAIDSQKQHAVQSLRAWHDCITSYEHTLAVLKKLKSKNTNAFPHGAKKFWYTYVQHNTQFARDDNLAAICKHAGNSHASMIVYG